MELTRISTDMLVEKGPQSIVAPTLVYGVDEHNRRAHHAITEFAAGASLMVEDGSTSDYGELIKQLTLALKEQSDLLARNTQRRTIPPWLSAVLVGIVTMVLGAIGTGLITYGAMQNRIANIEGKAQSIDAVASLAVKVDALSGVVTRMEERFNTMMDRRQPKEPQ